MATILNENANTTSSSSISATIQTYYDKKLIMSAKPQLVYQQSGQQRPLPKNSGKSISFRKWTPFSAITDALTEGVVPDGQSLEMTNVTATVAQYGGYVAVTDLLDLTALDPVINDSVELMGDQGGLSIDHITRDIVCAGTNVQYAGDATSRVELDPTYTLTTDDVRKAVRTLKRNHAPQFMRNGKGYFKAIVSPDAIYDLQNDSLWQGVAHYQQAEKIEDGEIGKLFGVIFFETPEAKIIKPTISTTVAGYASKVVTLAQAVTAGSPEAAALAVGKKVFVYGEKLTITALTPGAAGSASITVSETPAHTPIAGDPVYSADAGDKGAPVHCSLIFGRNAYGVVAIDNENFRTIIKARGSAGTSDPLEQLSTVGWKAEGYAAAILQPLWLVRLEHGVTA
ncbi:hypothetical protein SDC9_98431 [bioreactor metagenome]|uniref:N4-gp56 family major capsid protein n=1 Tax=bioreactor metagenome TaxID=1076179 RepID=A0A645AET8_9ZZZZ